MKGRKFTSNQTGEVVSVTDIFENIAILDNGERVSTRRLLDSNYYDSVIDPQEFLSSGLSIIQREISSIPEEKLNELPVDREIPDRDITNQFESFNNSESAVIITDIESEKRELLNRALKSPKQNNLSSNSSSLSRFLELEPDTPTPIQEKQIPTPPVSPRDLMFSGVKKIYPIKLSIEIETLIPKLEFIKLMEDSYEHSIIDYLTDEISQKIINDPGIIKNSIKDQIKKSVENSGYEPSSIIVEEPKKRVNNRKSTKV